MAKVGIIICSRYRNCGGGKCLRAIRERAGGFARYPKEETVELVGYSSCGGCPGGNVEYVPEEMKKNDVQVIHLATGLVVGYPPCPHLREFKELIEQKHALPVVIGTHPIPLRYRTAHEYLSFWKKADMNTIAGELLREERNIMAAYD
jgi:predicted metal-binding protein